MAQRSQTEITPSSEDIANILSKIGRSRPKNVPAATNLKTLEHAGIEPEIRVNGMVINNWSITDGDPVHGAKRSDDHVGLWEVEYNAREPCPECGGFRRFYRYRAHHHIAGSETEFCKECEEVIESEDWG